MNDLQTKKDFDVIICGGGAAGLSAALWCDDLGLDALLLEVRDELGGQLLRVYNPIKNHLGSSAENGRELRDIFLKQITERKFTLVLEAEIKEIDLTEKTFTLTSGERFAGKSVVIATGVSRRRLKVPGETEFKDRGIFESGMRDRNLIIGKTAAIVGGGDAALENTLILAETAAKVWLIHRRRELTARPEFVERVSAHPKIETLTETIVEKIIGSERVESIEVKNIKTGETRRLPINALLIRIGVVPNTELFRGKADLDDEDYIKIDSLCATNIKDVFAVGDVANPLAPTVSGAVGMGATAVKAIFAALNL